MKCQRCGECCKSFNFSMKNINADLKELLEAHYNKPMEEMTFVIEHKCEQLKEGNECAIYEKRSKICREFWCEKAKNG
jgi:Fe-S-cluster containining protein